MKIENIMKLVGRPCRVKWLPGMVLKATLRNVERRMMYYPFHNQPYTPEKYLAFVDFDRRQKIARGRNRTLGSHIDAACIMRPLI